MKLFIASDLHGSAYFCKLLVEHFRESGATHMLLLGDILYHGPRNALSRDYAPAEVASLLNEEASKIIAVRGNCDAEVDTLMLHFPIMASYAVIYDGKRVMYAVHGHANDPSLVPEPQPGTVLLFGHTHVPECTEREGVLYINPGSVSIPKSDSENSYIIYEDGTFTWRRVCDGSVSREHKLADL